VKCFDYFVVMKSCLLFITIIWFSPCRAQTASEIRQGKEGRFLPSDSSYVYSLPFEKGKKYMLVQAYQSDFSHRDEYALDFKMKPGTPVCAARSGQVVSVREDSQKGGLKKENLSDGNYIIIRHDDGSEAHYWHLQYQGVVIHEGDMVEKGQVIGHSGHTGYSAFPHLHFEVRSADEDGGRQIPTRFKTKKGIRYLKPMKWYRSI
jgi:murein DD-endopeptidase MepM/ murein hydrolase activator NlpD